MKNNEYLSEQELQVQILEEVKGIKNILRDNSKKLTHDIGYLDSADVMQALKISPKTLYNWQQKGILHGEKIGGKLFFQSKAIRDMMNEHFKRQ